MKRKTKIVCTIGPVSQSVAMLRALAKEGMDIARLNFSHGDHAYHQQTLDNIRKVNRTAKKKILVMQDLEGYRIRVGMLDNPLELKNGKTIVIRVCKTGGGAFLPLDGDFDALSVGKGMHIFIADGTIDLEVTQVKAGQITARVVEGGTVSSKKNVNIPGLKLRANIFTAKDERDLEFGIANKVDFVAQSFVRNKTDVLRVAKIVRPRLPSCRMIAKIETPEAVRNLDGILDACDGIIVARGDLGVTFPIYQVPVLQKKILFLSNRKKKFDITATQMLETMTEHPRPTRAEVNDVASAIIDGSGAVMLSGETAVGKFPVEAVRMMRQIIEYTEKSMRGKFSRKWRSPGL